jgi:MFS transporter, DHA2 family, methylenomycin A resistance protein
MPAMSRLPAFAGKRHRTASRHKRAGGPDRRPVPPEAWRTLAACTAAAALLQLDGTLITVALPSVAHSLRVSSSSTAIVLSAYFLAYAVALLPGGSLVDRFDARRLALVGLALFALGAAAGAVAQSITALVATRVVQGVGAGLVSPAALAGAVSRFPPERRGSALGIWGASAGVSNLLGPVIGGVLTVALGWRADWWALVPLALLAGIGIVRFVPSTVRGEDARHPVLNSTVVVASSVAALTFAIMIGCFYLAEQYLQRAVGFSALGASSVLVVVALLVGAAAPIAGRLADEHGERLPAVAGFLAAGLGLLVLGVPGVPLHGPVTILPLIPVGLGLGMLFVPTSRAALNATPMASHGRTSALLSIGRLLGAAVGAGLAGAALAAGVTGATVHTALLIACAACVLLGVPAAMRLGSGSPAAPLASER